MGHYKVIGIQPVLEHMPGDEFDEDLSPDLEEFLIQSGSLEKDPEKQPEPEPEEEEPEPEITQGP